MKISYDKATDSLYIHLADRASVDSDEVTDVEPSLAQAAADDRFQFERHGYFVADRKDHGKGKPVFNRVTGLKDSWGK